MYFDNDCVKNTSIKYEGTEGRVLNIASSAYNDSALRLITDSISETPCLTCCNLFEKQRLHLLFLVFIFYLQESLLNVTTTVCGVN